MGGEVDFDRDVTSICKSIDVDHSPNEMIESTSV